MTEKKYLNWFNKIGYGSGDIAGNVIFTFLSTFMMFYLTDTVGMNVGIVGTLMAISKLFDGVTDLFFGSLIDKTRTKMGKARPWMIYGFIGCAVCLAAIFFIPESWGENAQYAYFFIVYTMLNAVFYTANNIAYSSLTALITKNSAERVQLGSIRFMFAFGTAMVIQAVTLDIVKALGGGAEAWKLVAVGYAVIGLISNTISGLSVKELPEEEQTAGEQKGNEEKYTLVEGAKLLFANKYYVMICGVYLLVQLCIATMNMGVYYMKYILGNENLLGTFSLAMNIPVIIGLIITPWLVSKMGGMYKINIIGYCIAAFGRILVMIAGYMGNVPLMLVFSGFAAIGISPLSGDLSALVASCSEYTYLTTGKKIDGTMYSCSSFGTKVGAGLGTAICGWLLAAGGFVENAAVQTASAMGMMRFLYLWAPVILYGTMALLLTRLDVEKANKKILEAKEANVR